MENKIIKYNGIFSGGGVKGIAYLGALKALEQHGFSINKAGGTSVGAIIASLLMVGYNVEELLSFLKKTNLEELVTSFEIKKIGYYVKNKGLINSQSLYNLLQPLFINKSIWTYQDLMEKGRSKLKVTTIKVNSFPINRNQKIFEEIIIPDDLPRLNINPYTFPIIESVIMSSSFPGYFTPFQINNQTYIDGGIKDKINLQLFAEENTLRIAFYLKKNPKELFKPIKGGYLLMIDTLNTSSLNFKISEIDKKRLFESGYRSALSWIYSISNHS